MKKNFNRLKSKSNVIVLFCLSLVLFSCSNEIDSIVEDNLNEKGLRATVGAVSAFGGRFDWDRVDYISTKTQTGEDLQLSLPWRYGDASSLGIPLSWRDENAQSGVFSERRYAREKGWTLVYSNMHERQENKYFALYNNASIYLTVPSNRLF